MKGLKFPPLQPMRFVPVEVALPARYHFHHFDSEWFQYSILYFQRMNQFRYPNNATYYALYQNNDIATVVYELDNTTFSSIQMQIMDCSGNLINVSPSWLKQSIRPGNTYDAGGTIPPVQLRYHQWEFPISEFLPNQSGKYFLMLTVTYLDTSKEQYVSEPMMIKKSHGKTILYEYTHDRNEFDVFFDMNPHMSLRVPGYLRYTGSEFDNESFTNEELGVETLSGKTSRQYTVNHNAISQYHIDKIARIMCCRKVLLDGKQFALPENVEFPVSASQYSPLNSLAFPVQESKPDKDGQFFSGSSLFLYQVSGSGGSYPYAISDLKIRQSPGPAFSIIDAPVEIMNHAAETAFIASLNSTAASRGLAGTYSIISGYVAYTNAVGENYSTDTARVYKTWMRLAITSSTGRMVMLIGTNGYAGMDTVASLHTIGGIGTSTVARYGEGDIVITTPSAANYYTYIYTDDLMRVLNLSSFINPVITEITGSCSNSLETFSLGYASLAFSLSPLIRAQDRLKTLIIGSCTFSGFDVSAFNILPTSTAWKQLNYIGFRRNNMSNANQDTLYNTFGLKVAIYSITVGTIDTRLQSPSSAPTGTSATARSLMTTGGWIILT